jgi:hypothetical protein
LGCRVLGPSGESIIAEALANNTIVSRIKRLGWTYSAILYFQLARPKVLGLDRFKDSPSGKEPSRRAG